MDTQLEHSLMLAGTTPEQGVARPRRFDMASSLASFVIEPEEWSEEISSALTRSPLANSLLDDDSRFAECLKQLNRVLKTALPERPPPPLRAFADDVELLAIRRAFPSRADEAPWFLLGAGDARPDARERYRRYRKRARLILDRWSRRSGRVFVAETIGDLRELFIARREGVAFEHELDGLRGLKARLDHTCAYDAPFGEDDPRRLAARISLGGLFRLLDDDLDPESPRVYRDLGLVFDGLDHRWTLRELFLRLDTAPVSTGDRDALKALIRAAAQRVPGLVRGALRRGGRE